MQTEIQLGNCQLCKRQLCPIGKSRKNGKDHISAMLFLVTIFHKNIHVYKYARNQAPPMT